MDLLFLSKLEERLKSQSLNINTTSWVSANESPQTRVSFSLCSFALKKVQIAIPDDSAKLIYTLEIDNDTTPPDRPVGEKWYNLKIFDSLNICIINTIFSLNPDTYGINYFYKSLFDRVLSFQRPPAYISRRALLLQKLIDDPNMADPLKFSKYEISVYDLTQIRDLITQTRDFKYYDNSKRKLQTFDSYKDGEQDKITQDLEGGIYGGIYFTINKQKNVAYHFNSIYNYLYNIKLMESVPTSPADRSEIKSIEMISFVPIKNRKRERDFTPVEQLKIRRSSLGGGI